MMALLTIKRCFNVTPQKQALFRSFDEIIPKIIIKHFYAFSFFLTILNNWINNGAEKFDLKSNTTNNVQCNK